MKAAIKKLSRHLSPRRISTRLNEKKLIQAFAEENGLVYFGYIGTMEDEEERIVRGATVSVNHRDAHYCVGTYDGYDVSFVERSDALKIASGAQPKPHKWHIFELDLRTRRDIPHVFVGRHVHSDMFYHQLFTKYPAVRQIRLGALGSYDARFLDDFRVYARPADAIEVEKILIPRVTELIAKHFGNLAFEIAGGSLFIYSENAHVSHALLHAMLVNGKWLANQIDEPAHIAE